MAGDRGPAGGPPLPDEGVARNLSEVAHILLVMSGKGGVGKSTVAANLAVALAASGAAVGILDADFHGPNIPKMLGIGSVAVTGSKGAIDPVITHHGLKAISVGFLLESDDAPVIWRGPMKAGVIRQFLGEVRWGRLDYLVVDLPPGTGDEPLSIAQLLPGTGRAVVVCTPQDVALMDALKAVGFAKALGIPVIGVVENMSGFICPHCGMSVDVFKSGGAEKAAAALSLPFLGRVPLDPAIVATGDAGTSFLESHPDSEAAKAFRRVVEAIVEQLPHHKGEVS